MTDSSTQWDLFGSPPEVGERVEPAPVREEVVRVAARLPKDLHLGTSSWSFPGWGGIVYSQLYGVALLARRGLPAYARHPLLNSVNLDSTFYRAPSVEQLRRYAADVPVNFRFIAKAYVGLTAPPESSMALRRGIEPVFLDAAFAQRAVVGPLVEGLGSRLGAVLFQFSPLGARYTRAPGTFVERLEAFLSALPRGPVYAVELRDPEILGPEYEAALRRVGAVHCSNVHSRMPPVDRQVRRAQAGPLLIRWMLQPGDDYQSAATRYAPFDRLRAPDKVNRERIAGMIRNQYSSPAVRTAAGAADETPMSSECDVYVVAANNAEGCAPLTLLELAKTLVAN